MKTCYSVNEEDFSHLDLEDAAREAWEDSGNYEVGDIITLWESDAIQRKASEYLPLLCDDMSDRAYDDAGDFAEDWLPGPSDQYDSLQASVAKVVDQWMDERGLQPTFWTADNPREIQVRFTDEDGGCEIVSTNAERTGGTSGPVNGSDS